MSGVSIGTLTGTIEVVDHSQPAFASLTANVTAAGSKLDTLTSKSTSVQTAFTALGTSATTVGSSLTNATGPVNTLGNAAGTLGQRFAALDDGMKRIDAMLAGLGSTAGSTAAKLASVTPQVNALGTAAATTGSKVAAGATPHVTALGTAALGTSGKLSDLIGKATGAGSALGGIGTLLLAGGTIGAVTQFGRVLVDLGSAVFQNADAMVKMSDKTGIGTEALGRLQAVADASGNSIEQITTGVNMMQKTLGEGSKKTVGALAELGLTLSSLKGMKPEDQFAAIAGAIASIQDPAKQAQLAMELFGRSGADLLPTLKADILGIGNSARVASEETTRAIDKMGDAWQAWKRNMMAAAAEVFGFIIAQNQAADRETERMLQRLRDKDHLLERLPIAPATVPKWGDPLKDLGMPSPELMDYYDHHLQILTKRNTELLAAEKKRNSELEAATRKLNEEVRRAEEAAQKYVLQLVRQAESTDQLKFKTLSLSDAMHDVGGSTFVPSIKDLGDFSLRSATDVDTLAGSVEDLQRKGLFAEAAFRKMGVTFSTLPNVKPSVDIAEWRNTAISAGTTFTSALAGVLQKIPQTFQNAFTGGGGVMGALKAILLDLGQAIGMLIAQKISAAIVGGISGGVSTGTSGGGGSATGTAISTGTSLAGGAAATSMGITGASIGAAAATAGVTMGISLAVIGAIALYKAKHKSEWQKLGMDMGRDFGVELSKSGGIL